MEYWQQYPLGFFGLPPARQSFLLLRGRFCGHPDRGSSRGRTGGHHFHAPAGDLQDVSGRGDHHAGRDLLWGHVRRVHDLDPGQYSRGSRFGGDLPGRLPDGPQGQGRAGPGDCRLRFLHRRNVFGRGLDVSGSSAGYDRHQVRTPGVFCPSWSWG